MKNRRPTLVQAVDVKFPTDLLASAVVTPDVPVPDDLFSSVLIELKGHDTQVLSSYVQFLRMTATELEIELQEKYF